MITKLATILLLLCIGILFSFSAPKSGTLTINIQHLVGARPLVLDTAHYKNELGQDFTVTKLKYYLGKLILKKNDGSEFKTETYYLVDEDDENSKHLVLENIPFGVYTSMTFILGVDSLHNCNGAQSGALDPVNGMFWAWNTGYIFLKLEGKAPVSASPAHLFEFHIGGYRQPHNCIRSISLTLPELRFNEQIQTIALDLNADLLQLLKEPTTIDFSKLSSVTDFHNATVIADNYKDFFGLSTKNHAR